ncbi:MAG TPA: hypothetical protein V6C86_08415 [Oculatellaceae cyanobacterium]
MTQSIPKQQINPTWSIAEIQEHVVKMIAAKMQLKLDIAAQGKVLELGELQKASAQHKAKCQYS